MQSPDGTRCSEPELGLREIVLCIAVNDVSLMIPSGFPYQVWISGRYNDFMLQLAGTTEFLITRAKSNRSCFRRDIGCI